MHSGALPRLLAKNKMARDLQQGSQDLNVQRLAAYKLTGVLAVEPSNGSTTGHHELGRTRWDPEIASECGFVTHSFWPGHRARRSSGTVTQTPQ